MVQLHHHEEQDAGELEKMSAESDAELLDRVASSTRDTPTNDDSAIDELIRRTGR
jgi:hypothetical protein